MDALYHRKRVRGSRWNQPYRGQTRNGAFGIALIPHTGEETALLEKHPGDPVNIECDYLGKYVEQLMNRGPAEDLSMELLETLGHGGQYGI